MFLLNPKTQESPPRIFVPPWGSILSLTWTRTSFFPSKSSDWDLPVDSILRQTLGSREGPGVDSTCHRCLCGFCGALGQFVKSLGGFILSQGAEAILLNVLTHHDSKGWFFPGKPLC